MSAVPKSSSALKSPCGEWQGKPTVTPGPVMPERGEGALGLGGHVDLPARDSEPGYVDSVEGVSSVR